MERAGITVIFVNVVIGESSNIVLPFRAGEIVRIQFVSKRRGLRASSIVATLLSEKLMDIVAFCTFIVLGLLLFDEARFLWPLALAYGLIVLGGLACAPPPA